MLGSADAAAAGGVVVRGVRRTFGDVVAVDRIDLDAPAGQVTALVGPNGSGKTTLLLVLATLLAADEGQVLVAGHDPQREPAAVRARTGWMPDVFGTWATLTCREVLATVADAYRVPRAVARTRVGDLLELVHLADLADRPTQVLSRGQKQRLGLARALVHDPAVLLLDEPASGLDPRSRVELRATVRALAADGKAVLVSSHVLAELDAMAAHRRGGRAWSQCRGRGARPGAVVRHAPGASGRWTRRRCWRASSAAGRRTGRPSGRAWRWSWPRRRGRPAARRPRSRRGARRRDPALGRRSRAGLSRAHAGPAVSAGGRTTTWRPTCPAYASWRAWSCASACGRHGGWSSWSSGSRCSGCCRR